MNIYNDYLELVAKEKEIKKQILDLQCAIYEAHQKELDNMETGTFNASNEGFKIKIVKKLTPSVDQELAGTVSCGFSVKFALDKKEYKTLNDVQKLLVDACMTYKPAKPSFTIERE